MKLSEENMEELGEILDGGNGGYLWNENDFLFYDGYIDIDDIVKAADFIRENNEED